MSEVGHNSGAIAADKIRKVVDRIENLDEQIKGLQDDKKEIYAVAKAAGFEVTAIKKVVARRKRDREVVKAEDDMISLIEDTLYDELVS